MAYLDFRNTDASPSNDSDLGEKCLHSMCQPDVTLGESSSTLTFQEGSKLTTDGVLSEAEFMSLRESGTTSTEATISTWRPLPIDFGTSVSLARSSYMLGVSTTTSIAYQTVNPAPTPIRAASTHTSSDSSISHPCFIVNVAVASTLGGLIILIIVVIILALRKIHQPNKNPLQPEPFKETSSIESERTKNRSSFPASFDTRQKIVSSTSSQQQSSSHAEFLSESSESPSPSLFPESPHEQTDVESQCRLHSPNDLQFLCRIFQFHFMELFLGKCPLGRCLNQEFPPRYSAADASLAVRP
ncbi:hypothetical protein H2248_010089 [Termitomyces sp. 'cryptogamus']|nr:hypothetical protein H2248_010089 [Termitomyces sp. 'cryptogamus']